MDGKLTDHFNWGEVTASDTAKRLGLKNTPTPEAAENLKALFNNVIEPLRVAYGRPLQINSGYRSPAVNKAVGGVATSQHTTGQACDIEPVAPGYEKDFCLFVISKINELPIDQAIIEFADGQGRPKWMHISHTANPRRNILLAEKQNGRTVYIPVTPEVLASRNIQVSKPVEPPKRDDLVQYFTDVETALEKLKQRVYNR